MFREWVNWLRRGVKSQWTVCLCNSDCFRGTINETKTRLIILIRAPQESMPQNLIAGEFCAHLSPAHVSASFERILPLLVT